MPPTLKMPNDCHLSKRLYALMSGQTRPFWAYTYSDCFCIADGFLYLRLMGPYMCGHANWSVYRHDIGLLFCPWRLPLFGIIFLKRKKSRKMEKRKRWRRRFQRPWFYRIYERFEKPFKLRINNSLGFLGVTALLFIRFCSHVFTQVGSGKCCRFDSTTPKFKKKNLKSFFFFFFFSSGWLIMPEGKRR